ncbi:unnamed protein product [Gongylonema pulchrum]|uniref:LisH domain-containing protein n=1 Tax=Gongylonema pulchrum TaxID=637853 RepID=A0A183DF44_9BILA|nr:unnamed protein product [Gongylonema pulchrum]
MLGIRNGNMLVKCCAGASSVTILKNMLSEGYVADYCTDVVETELWEDYCRIWEYIAEVISWSIMCEVRHFEGPRPSLGDFKAAFRSADADIRDPSPLLVHVLKRLVLLMLNRIGTYIRTL